MHDLYAMQAEIFDLSRRLDVLEALILGSVNRPAQPTLLVGLYWDACRATEFDETSARHWERQLYAIDARGLLIIARLVRDPFPWHPMLVLLDRYIEAGFDLETCRQHVLKAAEDLLKIQGLSKILPRDVLGNPLRIKSVLSAISQRGDLHGRRQAT